jgi:hypothetical protein
MKTKISILLLALAVLFGCQQTQPAASAKIKKGMIKVAILYANGEGKPLIWIIMPPNTCPWQQVYLEALESLSIDKG